MRTVTDISRRPGINTQFCEIAAEICRPVLLQAFPFMAVVAHKHKIRLPFCFLDGTDDTVRILFVHFGNRTGLFTGRRRLKTDISHQIAACQRFVEAFLFQQHAVSVHFRLIHDLAKGFQFLR